MSTNVTNWEELAGMTLNGDYILTADLDKDSVGYDTYAGTTANSNLGWLPIGTEASPFSGKLNGNGFTISDLVISRSATVYVGLFGYLNGGSCSLTNVRVLDVTITSTNTNSLASTGALAGRSKNCSTTHCYSSGTVTGVKKVGGLFGYNENTISQNYSTCTVVGDTSGGLIGHQAGGELLDCYAVGIVIGTTYAGGLTGRLGGNIATTCYSIGAISGNVTYIGGLTGSVTSGSAINCYYDKTTSGQSDTGKGVGLTTEQAILSENYVGFDFTTVWDWSADVNSGYPTLKFFGDGPEGNTDPIVEGPIMNVNEKNLAPTPESANPILASGQLLDSTTDAEITVEPGVYVVTPVSGYITLGYGIQNTDANIIWSVCTGGPSVHVCIPVGIITLHYKCTGTGSKAYLRKVWE